MFQQSVMILKTGDCSYMPGFCLHSVASNNGLQISNAWKEQSHSFIEHNIQYDCVSSNMGELGNKCQSMPKQKIFEQVPSLLYFPRSFSLGQINFSYVRQMSACWTVLIRLYRNRLNWTYNYIVFYVWCALRIIFSILYWQIIGQDNIIYCNDNNIHGFLMFVVQIITYI